MLPKIIDNQRKSLAEVLREEAPKHKHLSIATGYWDLPGTLEIIDQIKNYESIRLLIGAEPFSSKKLDIDNLYSNFPEEDIKIDLENIRDSDKSQQDKLRKTAKELARLAEKGILKVRICRRPFLHAKTYIFGTYDSESAVGIIGSSNFTRKGLQPISDGGNAELNTVESEPRIVSYIPQNEAQEYGHLSWFDSFWDSDYVEEWSGDFSRVLRNSPVGDLTFGPFDTYIKTLMECFPDEMVKMPELDADTNDILYKYQSRNAGILINKLEKMGMAILADSVGLGKTITAAAVISHYIAMGKDRVVIIVPAALKSQWIDDLRNIFNLAEGINYQIISQQDIELIKQKTKDYRQVKANVDLFIIDEAHNLRSEGSERHQAILEWLRDNEQSRVLMLTATPINNSLNDLVNLIRLGLKGSLDSVPVQYRRTNGELETVDFFEALQRIQKAYRKAQSQGQSFDWEGHRRATLADGISRYLVRSTRQGVEQEGTLVAHDGTPRHFPKSEVKNASYSFSGNISSAIASNIDAATMSILNGIEARCIDLEGDNSIIEATRQTRHPLDFAQDFQESKPIMGVIPNMFQLITLLGFTPYRPEMYRHTFYAHAPSEVSEYLKDKKIKKAESRIINTQLSVHNILRVSWLKRLESSTFALLKSVRTYNSRLTKFMEYLDKGYILSFGDLTILNRDYGEDLDKAFDDYEEFMEELSVSEKPEELKKRGIERHEADPQKYNIEQLRKDCIRDQDICGLIDRCLSMLVASQDSKMTSFIENVKTLISSKKYGKKVLVFSFFADTISYLRDNLKYTLGEDADEIMSHCAFVSGQNSRVNDVTKRFSPKSKGYTFESGETEIDYLFATDVLSEGQNLQDSGILINYDLHWNPVRMIQRNGRINRLGSTYSEVLISNMTPEDHIELYLNLITRLQSKIDTIKNSVGLDQGVISNDDINPIEYVEDLRSLYGQDTKGASSTMKKLDVEDDIFSWTNDHVFVLRSFLKTASEKEIERISNIPHGKWSYLPTNSSFDSEHIISLHKAIGKTSITGQPISQTFFMSTETETGLSVTELLDEQKALNYIKASPEDNKRRIDKINLDRPQVTKRAKKVATTQAEGSQYAYDVKPSRVRALEIMSAYYKGDLLTLVSENLRNSQHRRRFEQIVREINSEYNEDGFVNAPTIQKFCKLMDELAKIEKEDFIVEDVDDILYYMKEPK